MRSYEFHDESEIGELSVSISRRSTFIDDHRPSAANLPRLDLTLVRDDGDGAGLRVALDSRPALYDRGFLHAALPEGTEWGDRYLDERRRRCLGILRSQAELVPQEPEV